MTRSKKKIPEKNHPEEVLYSESQRVKKNDAIEDANYNAQVKLWQLEGLGILDYSETRNILPNINE